MTKNMSLFRMNDDDNCHVEACTVELVSGSENVQVVVNEMVTGRETLSAISELGNSAGELISIKVSEIALNVGH